MIDVSAIDADVTAAGDQAFTFIAMAATAAGHAGGAGTLWLENVGGQTRIFGIVDNHGTIDLAIRVNDGAVLAWDYTSGDFVL